MAVRLVGDRVAVGIALRMGLALVICSIIRMRPKLRLRSAASDARKSASAIAFAWNQNHKDTNRRKPTRQTSGKVKAGACLLRKGKAMSDIDRAINDIIDTEIRGGGLLVDGLRSTVTSLDARLIAKIVLDAMKKVYEARPDCEGWAGFIEHVETVAYEVWNDND